MQSQNGKVLQVPASSVQPAASIVQPPASSEQPAASSVQPPATAMESPATAVESLATAVPPSARKSHRSRRGFATDASIDERLVAAQVGIDKVLGNPQLQARMAAHGYSAARMLHGRALRDQALALQQGQQAAYGAQIAATDARIALQNQIKASYTRHVAKARVTLRENRSAAHTLDLGTARKRNRAGWLIQAQQFYTNLLADPALVASITEYGVTYEQLAAAQQALVAIEAALVVQQDTKDAAIEAMRARDVGLKALSRWMQDFQAIARVELAEHQRSAASNAGSAS